MEESELIDKYLRGELDHQRSESFSAQLRSNAELQRKVSLRKLVIEGVSQSYAEELKSRLAEFDRSLENKGGLKPAWKMVAAFAILIVMGSVLYFYELRKSAYDFDIPESGIPNVMGTGHNVEINNAMSVFKAGDSEAAGRIFGELLSNDPKNDTLLYFSGLCDFRTKQPVPAIQKWSKIGNGSIFFTKTQYRLAIAYWATKEKNKAVGLLQKITKEENSLLRQQAENALSALNQEISFPPIY
jgi:hypothetical protein